MLTWRLEHVGLDDGPGEVRGAARTSYAPGSFVFASSTRSAPSPVLAVAGRRCRARRGSRSWLRTVIAMRPAPHRARRSCRWPGTRAPSKITSPNSLVIPLIILRGRRSMPGWCIDSANWWPALARARPDRSGAHHRAVPVLAGQRLDVARLRRRTDAAGAVGARPRRPDRRVARRHRLHDAGDVHRREPRRARRRRVRRAPSRALRAARHDLRRPAARRLGHRDAPPAARARARRPAHRRRRDRHDPRAPARHADLPRPRRARHAVRRARARARAAAGRRVPRSPRPAVRGAVSGAHVPAAQRGDRSLPVRRRSGGRARRARARHRRRDRRRRARRPAVPVRAAARAVSRAAGGRRAVARCGSSTPSTATTRSSPIRTGSPTLLRDAGAFGGEPRRRRGRASRASARSRCARSGSA